MAELNFGLLTPPGSESIGNAFVRGQDQARAAQMQNLQMQQSQRQGQMAEFQFKKAQDTEAKLNQYYSKIKTLSGLGSPKEIEDAMLGSDVPHVQDQGMALRTKRLQNEEDIAKYAAANAPPVAPAPAAPSVAAAPNYAGLANQLMPAGGYADTANRLMPAPDAAPVNALPAQVAAPVAAPPDLNARIATITDQINRNIALNTPRGKAQVAVLEKELAALRQTHSAGGTVFNSEFKPVATAAATPTELAKLITERAALPPGSPLLAGYDARIAEITTAPGAQRLIANQNVADSLALRRQNYDLGKARFAAEQATGNFSAPTIDFLAETYRNTGVLPQFGIGKAAAGMRQTILERAAELAMAPAVAGGPTISAADAAATVGGNKQAFAGGTAAQRTLGTIEGNVRSAANEANNMFPIVEKYAAKVNPTNYPLLNSVGNFVDRQGGDGAIVGLAASLNGLVNSYARAINPKGVGTVSDKDHARKVINEAMSKGQLSTAIEVMRAEVGAALAAPKQAQEQLRSDRKTPAAVAPAGQWGVAKAVN